MIMTYSGRKPTPVMLRPMVSSPVYDPTVMTPGAAVNATQ